MFFIYTFRYSFNFIILLIGNHNQSLGNVTDNYFDDTTVVGDILADSDDTNTTTTSIFGGNANLYN